MRIIFYQRDAKKCSIKEFISKQPVKDRAKILACLKCIEELGFHCPRVQFRQVRGQLWEIKIKAISAGYRIFYVTINKNLMVLLHCYQKQSQKAPTREIKVATKRMMEVFEYENDYT